MFIWFELRPQPLARVHVKIAALPVPPDGRGTSAGTTPTVQPSRATL